MGHRRGLSGGADNCVRGGALRRGTGTTRDDEVAAWAAASLPRRPEDAAALLAAERVRWSKKPRPHPPRAVCPAHWRAAHEGQG